MVDKVTLQKAHNTWRKAIAEAEKVALEETARTYQTGDTPEAEDTYTSTLIRITEKCARMRDKVGETYNKAIGQKFDKDGWPL